MEITATMQLMKKMIHFAKIGTPLSIISATYKDNLDQYIFVEAYKIENVREAIQGLNSCFFKIDMLPLNEMTKVYENSDNNLVRPKKGQWVRIKGTLYTEDLGYVDEYIGDDKIYVKLIPRIDPNVKKDAKFTF